MNLAWLRVHYDHRFAPGDGGGTHMTWIVSSSGPGTSLTRPTSADDVK